MQQQNDQSLIMDLYRCYTFTPSKAEAIIGFGGTCNEMYVLKMANNPGSNPHQGDPQVSSLLFREKNDTLRRIEREESSRPFTRDPQSR